MTQIRVNLSEKENEIISICKIRQRLKTKAEAIKKMIDECGASYTSELFTVWKINHNPPSHSKIVRKI